MPFQRRRFTSSRIPAQKLADRISTQCEAKNRSGTIHRQIRTQESIIRQAQITILKYKKELQLIEEKVSSLPKTKRELNKEKPNTHQDPEGNGND